jgi:hypothetical protein
MFCDISEHEILHQLIIVGCIVLQTMKTFSDKDFYFRIIGPYEYNNQTSNKVNNAINNNQ